MEQKLYWDSVSEKKEFTTPFQIEEFSKFVEKDGTVLDVGCGYGRTLEELHQLDFQHLIGIDFSDDMIKRGHVQFPHLDLRVKKDETIDMPDESVDAVILFAVLTCIASNEEQQELIREIYRVLKPGGILYVNDFLLNTDERNISRYDAYHKEHGGEYGTFALPEGAICRHHDKIWMKELLEHAGGFDKMAFEHLTFTTMNGNKSNGFYFIGKK